MTDARTNGLIPITREAWERLQILYPAADILGLRVVDGVVVPTSNANEALGTFACPICNSDKPHSHTEAEQTAYREDQFRNDGWTSTAKRVPLESGWYLCMDIRIPREQQGSSIRDSQLDWFSWVRDGAAYFVSNLPTQIPEVLYWDHLALRWSLRNLLGNGGISGAETRWEVYAQPRYWRLVPALSASQEGESRQWKPEPPSPYDLSDPRHPANNRRKP